jgi:single-strand DNA-binding protein
MINKVTILGNLGKDPELRFTTNGTPVTELRVATSRVFFDKQNTRREDTQWHRVVVWGKQAVLCKEYLDKGRQVYVEGRLQTRQWEDREGNKRTTTEIVAENVRFLGNRKPSVDVPADEPIPE